MNNYILSISSAFVKTKCKSKQIKHATYAVIILVIFYMYKFCLSYPYIPHLYMDTTYFCIKYYMSKIYFRHAATKANFSISTDDPTVTGSTLDDEYNLVKQWGLTNEQIHLCVSKNIAQKFNT